MTSYISLHGESKVIRPASSACVYHGHSSASGLRESCNSWAMLVVNVRGLPTPPDLEAHAWHDSVSDPPLSREVRKACLFVKR